MAEKKLCCDCAYFEYDETWDGEEEIEIYICKKEHYERIVNFNAEGCDDWRADDETD